MRILMINKFLHPNGGSETYLFQLGGYLESLGHEVQYFGMEHPQRRVGNRVESYTANMDFHKGSAARKLLYPIKTIYSAEARKKIRKVLEDFRPQVCHLNNFNYQLTPSVILEIRKWEKECGQPCTIVYTAHDGQLVCPNHQMRNPTTGENCEKCLTGGPVHCMKNRCIHQSLPKSALGTLEAIFWKAQGGYREIDTILCCSDFMKRKLDTNPMLAERTVLLPNFVEKKPIASSESRDYVLYFGRYSQEKGIDLLLRACQALPEIPFVFAGSGPLESAVNSGKNVQNRGFLKEAELENLIRGARFSICPSTCYENCPFSVTESLALGTPVLGADIGGIPELIQPGRTGELFESGSAPDLAEKIRTLWEHPERTKRYSENCAGVNLMGLEDYTSTLLELYQHKHTRRTNQ